MNKFKFHAKRHALSAILAVCLLAVGGIAGAALNKKNQEIENGKSDLTKANEKIVAMSNDLGAAKSEAEMATKDLADLKEKMTNQAEDLAAFAKQAAACESVKKKLNIKK
jgi:hypothetical protein